MMDGDWIPELNTKKDAGVSSVVLKHQRWAGGHAKYQVDLVDMTQCRMSIADGSQPILDAMEAAKPYRETGFSWNLQYNGDWGWKNMDPGPHRALMEALEQGKNQTSVIHVWEHYRNGVQRDEYTVDLSRLKQKAHSHRKNQREIRLVATRLMDTPASW
jgi:hypothetical protein